MKKIALTLSLLIFAVGFQVAIGQVNDTVEGYVFTPIKEIKTTSVKNQYRSSTCWSFSGVAFLESELLRMGKPEVNLSAMYVVRNAYSEKADRFVRFNGTNNFGPGGSYYDVIETIRKYGVVPDEVYPGLNYGEDKHTHGELDAVARAYVDAIVKNPNKKLSTAWKSGFSGILDAYLGINPSTFTYNGKNYNPNTFFQSLGLNLDDYIYITSFSHHPFYTKFVIELPDNWAHGEVYNVTIEDFEKIFDNAVDNGYPVAWASDVSDKGFNWSKGVAIVPEVNFEEMSGSDKERWTQLSQKDKDAKLYSFEKPGKEMKITQELRQEAFNNYQTTDDHGMLLVGKAKDQTGTVYYKVKNSWGADGVYDGYFYASKPFVLYKTTSIMVHKNAVPKDIMNKLGIK
ncbi:aminopeptidase [Tenuifilaceae bacterium CYCD]|nr:aminopeptidase [Tenuifilaceae bacterium CYCD]